MLIEEYNRGILRPALQVNIGIDTSSEVANVESVKNYITGYENNAYITDEKPQQILMDLCGGGFYNDGNARPISTDTLTSSKYGYQSEIIANEDGYFDVESVSELMSWRIAEPTDEDYLTFVFADSNGNRRVEIWQWSTFSGSFNLANLTAFEPWYPNERVILLRVSVGKSWYFTNDDLISCVVSLRGNETTPEEPQFQLSEIEIQAYEPDDYSELIGQMAINTPIWYQTGYEGELTAERKFYLNQRITQENNVLTFHGYDASYLLDVEHGGSYNTATQGNVKTTYANALFNIISGVGIDVTSEINLSEASSGTASNVFFDNSYKRSIIANAMNICRGDYQINYVDAGIPKFTVNIEPPTWTIYYDECADFKTEIEYASSGAHIDAYFYTVGARTEIQTMDVESGNTYFINTSEPIQTFSVSAGTISKINYYTAVLKATSTAQVVVYGTPIVSVTNKNEETNLTYLQKGHVIEYKEQQVLTDLSGSVTLNSLVNSTPRSNILYTFTYRGNPHIQPWDWIKFINGDDTIEMTVESITLNHAEGGLTSVVTARKGHI